MAVNVKSLWGLIKTAATAWVNDKAPRLGAALAYYTVFAIPPLFVIVIFIASLVFDPSAVRSQMFSEVGGLVGEKSAQAIESAMAAQYQNSKGTIASIIAVVALMLTATGLFIELQDALNSIWGVREKSGQGIYGFIRNRMLSFAMVVGIGFLLLVSLVVSAALSAFGKFISDLVPGLDIVAMVANAAVSFCVIAVLFGMIYKVLPDVRISWGNVWFGSVVTAFLFTGGKFGLGLYLGRSSIVTAYGAAGSVVLILLWVYYSAQILFFGAELTKVYANRYGARIQPSRNAEWTSPPPAQPAAAPAAGGGRPAELVSELKEEVESLRQLVQSRPADGLSKR